MGNSKVSVYAELLPALESFCHSVRSWLRIPLNVAVTCCVPLVLAHIVCAMEGVGRT